MFSSHDSNSHGPGRFKCMSTKQLIATINNSSSPGQNGRYFGRRQFQMHFLNENDRIPIRISLNFVPRSPIDNNPALVQVMAWRRTGAKPLPELMLTQFTDAYMRHLGEMRKNMGINREHILNSFIIDIYFIGDSVLCFTLAKHAFRFPVSVGEQNNVKFVSNHEFHRWRS